MKEIKSKLKRKELLIIAAVVVVCILSLVLMYALSKQGNFAVVSVNGSEIMRISLAKNDTYSIDANLKVTLEVKGGKIRFINSLCHDHICEDFGWIGEEYEYAVCMPAGTVVTISSSES